MMTKYKKFKALSTGSWVPENFDKRTKSKTYDILVNNLVLKALIGIHDFEKNKKQKISISLSIKVSDDLKKTEDNIENVVSYEHIVNDIKSIVNEGHIGLLETLAERITKICFSEKRILSVRVKIEKLEVFKETESVGIEIYRENNSVLTKKVGKLLKIKK